MKIYIGADHNGFELKAALTEQLVRSGYEVIDEGDAQRKPEDDFPVFASKVVHAMRASDDADPRGVLICGSGQGMCMAANRYKGIRASLIWEPSEAHAARNDDNSNVLCLPASRLNADESLKIALAWLTTPFAAAPRYRRRLKELDQLGS